MGSSGLRANFSCSRRHGRETLLPLTPGMAIGLPAAIASAQLIRDQLFEIGRRDPSTMGVAIFAIAGVGALAGYLPARRAGRVDPTVALRYE